MLIAADSEMSRKYVLYVSLHAGLGYMCFAETLIIVVAYIMLRYILFHNKCTQLIR